MNKLNWTEIAERLAAIREKINDSVITVSLLQERLK